LALIRLSIAHVPTSVIREHLKGSIPASSGFEGAFLKTDGPNPRSVLIVDDHPIIREALKAKLIDWGWNVLAEAEDGRHALEYTEGLCPDVVLVDISLPDMSGLEVTRRIKESFPGVHVVVLTVHREASYLVEAFAAGASGYVAKRSALDKLSACLDAVVGGNLYVDSSLSGAAVESFRGSPPRSDIAKAAASLTEREQEVVRLLVQGLSSREVGEKLFISSKTVDNHRTNVMNKLGLTGFVGLVRYAASHGLLDLNSWKDG
jgi:DNA-binding NarL/FixJ family response regulator